MPIRIERDPQSGGSNNRRRASGGGGGGGGSIMNFIPLIMSLFGRNPKMLIVIIVIGGLWYFFGKGCNTGTSDSAPLSGFNLGALFDDKKYASTEIFEPLADNVRNPLPDSVSLLRYAPKRLNQGQQGSCVAWASAYAARSIIEARETGADPNQTTFSPSYLYNQIHLDDCQGAYLPEAMKVMKGAGLAPFKDFPYDDSDCSSAPPDFLHKKAQDFKIDGYQRLTLNDQGSSPGKVDMLAIKQNLAQGAPVVIGMMVGGSFMQNMVGKELWVSEESDDAMQGFGGHAMCLIGYSDYAFGTDAGGFQIMNSWGPEWGKNGVAWVSYSDFDHFVKEAYGIYPGGNASASQTTLLDAQVGIVLNADDSNLSLVQQTGNTFRTSRKMSPREKFKLQVTNNIECYIYVFGQETDGSSYVLFPSDAKHSPFCGITGTRLFPRDASLLPDDVGNKDYFAIVLTKEPLDYNDAMTKISNASGNTYAEKIGKVFPVISQNTGGKTIAVKMNFATQSSTALVIEVDK
ncbi:MAG: C1 family peptidase [Flavobacteriales bacterium]|nr:C1 family peptidase [Flavobacteriales bacterium]